MNKNHKRIEKHIENIITKNLRSTQRAKNQYNVLEAKKTWNGRIFNAFYFEVTVLVALV